MTFGDSIIQNANLATSDLNIQNQADSEIAWAMMAAPSAVHYNYWDATTSAVRGANFGIAGDTATQCLERIDAVIASGAQIVILSAGTNVGVNVETAGQTIASLQEILKRFREAGMYVIIGTVRPRQVSNSPTGSQISAASWARCVAISDWIRASSNPPWVTVWDPVAALLDPSPIAPLITGSPLPAYIRDEVHFKPLGAFTSSATLKTAIDSLITPGTWFTPLPNAAALFSNGNLTGTGGTVSGTAVSGVCPDTHFFSNLTNASSTRATAVGSQEDNAGTGGKTFVITITTTSGAGTASNVEEIRFQRNAITTGFTSTDWVSLFVEVDIGASAANGGVEAIIVGAGKNLFVKGMGSTLTNRATEPYPTAAYSGWIVSEPALCGAATSLTCRLIAAGRIDLSASWVVKVKQWLLLKVTDPSVTFPYVRAQNLDQQIEGELSYRVRRPLARTIARNL